MHLLVSPGRGKHRRFDSAVLGGVAVGAGGGKAAANTDRRATGERTIQPGAEVDVSRDGIAAACAFATRAGGIAPPVLHTIDDVRHADSPHPFAVAVDVVEVDLHISHYTRIAAIKEGGAVGIRGGVALLHLNTHIVA